MVTPKVSVCIPTYNYARYLPEAIESVLTQRFEDFELLVVDDHSPDDSPAVIETYAGRDHRIVWSVNERNVGMVANWNLCLERARGEYVRFLFGDDYLASPDALGLMVEVLDRHPGVALCGSAREIVDESSQRKRVVSRFSDRCRYRGRDVVRRSLLEERNPVGEPSAVMFRRRQALRGFDPLFRQLVDLEMWFHLLTQGDYFHLEAPLVAFREHGEQQTVHNARAGVLVGEMAQLNADYGRRPEVANRFWRWFFACQALHRIRQRTSRARDLDANGERGGDGPGAGKMRALEGLVYGLIKPMLKMWYRFGAGRVRW